MEENPYNNALTSSIKSSQRNGGCYSSKGWTNTMSIILDEILDNKGPHTFGHVMYLDYLCEKNMPIPAGHRWLWVKTLLYSLALGATTYCIFL
uniref:Uncharacterized protein n=2 Tax=Anguilla anguilla TaxID=7936 RepID=A0A0E9STK9_ANGAN